MSRYSKILIKIEIYRKFWLKSRFLYILIKIEISENVHENEILLNFDDNTEILIKVKIFRMYGPKWRFSKIFTEIKIYRKFLQKSRFFKNLD